MCLDYDASEARLVLVHDGARHEIEIRAQAHRLVRHMAERNAQAHAPVLCTHEELMQAVWGEQPLHTHEELARLVWEVRRKLEPLDAAQLLENVRGLGYRMRTCEAPRESVAARTSGRRRWLLAAAVSVLLVAGAGVSAGILATRGSTPPRASTVSGAQKLRTFVDRVENLLVQSNAGRREFVAALHSTFQCRISPRVAARRIASVGDNRQSVLDQLSGLQAPTLGGDRVVTLLQRALQWSIEADRHYRDALDSMGHTCPLRSNLGLVLAQASDRKADAAKRRFLSAFNPLAERFGRRAWTAGEI